jgi:hypothetical protein
LCILVAFGRVCLDEFGASIVVFFVDQTETVHPIFTIALSDPADVTFTTDELGKDILLVTVDAQHPGLHEFDFCIFFRRSHLGRRYLHSQGI